MVGKAGQLPYFYICCIRCQIVLQKSAVPRDIEENRMLRCRLLLTFLMMLFATAALAQTPPAQTPPAQTQPAKHKSVLNVAAANQATASRNHTISQGVACGASSANTRRIMAALDRRVELAYVETPLKDVMADLARKAGVNIVFNLLELDGIGVTPDFPVSRNLKDIALRSALRLVLHEAGLAYIVRNEVLMITSRDDAFWATTNRLYPVSDLFTPGQNRQEEVTRLTDFIMRSVAAGTWSSMGGEGAIAPVWLQRACYLKIRHTPRTHEEIAALLVALRNAASEENTQPAAAKPAGRKHTASKTNGRRRTRLVKMLPRPEADAAAQRPHRAISRGALLQYPSAATRRIYDALTRPVEFAFLESPLIDVAGDIEAAAGIQMEIDLPVLEGVGVGADAPVTRSIKGVPLSAALHLLLKDLELTFCVRNEVLMITTPEEAADHAVGRLYRVDDLVAPAAPVVQFSHRQDGAADSIRDLITSSVRPEAWPAGSGPSPISQYWIQHRGVLVIHQTDVVHAEIASLLESLRTVAVGRAKKAAGTANRRRQCAYPLAPHHRKEAARFASIVQFAIKRNGGAAEAVGGVVVVRADEQGHAATIDILSSFDVLAPGRFRDAP